MKLMQSFFTSLFQDVVRQPTQKLNTAAPRAVPNLSQKQTPPAASKWPLTAGLVMLPPMVLSVLFVLT